MPNLVIRGVYDTTVLDPLPADPGVAILSHVHREGDLLASGEPAQCLHCLPRRRAAAKMLIEFMGNHNAPPRNSLQDKTDTRRTVLKIKTVVTLAQVRNSYQLDRHGKQPFFT